MNQEENVPKKVNSKFWEEKSLGKMSSEEMGAVM